MDFYPEGSYNLSPNTRTPLRSTWPALFNPLTIQGPEPQPGVDRAPIIVWEAGVLF